MSEFDVARLVFWIVMSLNTVALIWLFVLLALQTKDIKELKDIKRKKEKN